MWWLTSGAVNVKCDITVKDTSLKLLVLRSECRVCFINYFNNYLIRAIHPGGLIRAVRADNCASPMDGVTREIM